jgi:hypothetical protein
MRNLNPLLYICNSMRTAAAIILSLLLLLQTFSSWIVIGNYELNKAYITKNLCVNRYKPQLNCNGQCLLMKKLAAAEDRENSREDSKGQSTRIKPVEILFFQEQSPLELTVIIPDAVAFSNKNSHHHYSSPSFGIFHPPRLG